MYEKINVLIVRLLSGYFEIALSSIFIISRLLRRRRPRRRRRDRGRRRCGGFRCRFVLPSNVIFRYRNC